MADSPAPSPRGTKRKASTSLDPTPPRRIRALAADVVNKIAAGEIIVAPVHALKELVENAVDAGATALDVLVKEGGLKVLQITDNGCGIDKQDLPILCERHTTSKLKVFEDLSSIGTYGFRGEALASISHIAHLKVATRTQESSCAWEAHYADGKLVSPKPGQSDEPRAKAGRRGTVITVEDLFYNVPSRRRAFRSASEEYAKILDLVGKYAIHCAGVSFSCKKIGDHSGSSVSVPVAANIKDRIRQIHGSAVANELVQLKSEDERWGFKCEGWVSSANFSAKRTTMLLFINHRSVESAVIKKSIEQTYATFLPKGGHPFFYLSLEIEPQRVDVNVHPTKREVHFLNEDEIIAMICDDIRTGLSKVDTSRSFMAQSLLSGPNKSFTTPIKPNSPSAPVVPDATTPSVPRFQRPSISSTTKRHENTLIRTDSSARKITSMLPPQRSHSSAHATSPTSIEPTYTHNDRISLACRLTSIKELRAEVRDSVHNELTDIISTHTFIGIVDDTKRIAAIQGGVKLFLVDYGLLCRELFYQIGLTDFANYGAIRFDPPLALSDLLRVGAEQEALTHSTSSSASNASNADLDWTEITTRIKNHLLSKSAMLHEYLNLSITPSGYLESLPLLIKGYTPCLAKLPRFLMRLGPCVEWGSEKACFGDLVREVAQFYTPESLPVAPMPDVEGNAAVEGAEAQDMNENSEIEQRRKHIHRALEATLLPACKARLVGTKGLLKGLVEVANLKGLYRVFERC